MSSKNSLKVPHVKQNSESGCGAAVLFMVYKYYGLDHQTEEKIWARLKKLRKLNNSEEIIYSYDLYKDIRSNGFHTIIGQAIWQEPEKVIKLLEEFLRIRVPLIVCQRLREDKPLGHYKIVIGLEKDFVLVNDPEFEEDFVKVPKDKFIKDWQKYSDEIIGGQFIAALDEKQIKELRELPLIGFEADIKGFVASDFQFLP